MRTIFQVTDLLHRGHTVRVPGDEIAATVSAWLAELGARSPFVTDLAQAVGAGDWPTVYAIGERLSVDVTVGYAIEPSAFTEDTDVRVISATRPIDDSYANCYAQ